MEKEITYDPDPDARADYMIEILSAGIAEVTALHERLGGDAVVTTHLNSGQQQMHEASQTTHFESMFLRLKAAYHCLDAAKDESEIPDVRMKLETEVLAEMWGYIQEHDPEFDTGECEYSSVESVHMESQQDISD